MTGCVSEDLRLVLRYRNRRWGELLPARMAVELAGRLIARPRSTDGGSSADSAAARVATLARSSAPLAAWLMDRLTHGARPRLLTLAPDADADRTPAIRAVSEGESYATLDGWLGNLARTSLLEYVSSSLEVCQVAKSDLDAWQQAQRRSLAVADRAVSLGESVACVGPSQLRFWALYLTSPVGSLEKADQSPPQWKFRSLSLPDALPENQPLADIVECVRRASAEVDSVEQLEEVRGPADDLSTCLTMLIRDALERARRQEQLEYEYQQTLEREKLLAMKELAYGASHEINNPLANISSRAQLLLRGEIDPERRRWLAIINSQAFRAHEMIADMMLFAKPPTLQRERIELEAFLGQLLDRLAGDLPVGVTFERRLELDRRESYCDPAQLTEAIRAIWQNALEAMGPSGWLRVVGRIATAGDGTESVQLDVADSGPGIRPEVRRHLFDPFFSGREAGRGLGFGLSKAWRIVDQHGGQLTVASEPGSGAVFTLRLPLSC